jgi:copper oxidase (laccase) domain-containing protein
MQKEYGSNPKDIICCICPSIRKCHFEVEKDVQTLFENEFKDLKLDEINYFLSEFDMEINSFNEFEEAVEELLAKNIINIEEIEPFKPLLEKLKEESFVKYLDEVL